MPEKHILWKSHWSLQWKKNWAQRIKTAKNIGGYLELGYHGNFHEKYVNKAFMKYRINHKASDGEMISRKF